MRERRIRLRPELVGTALLALAGTAWGQQFNITGLRTDSVTLYRDCKIGKIYEGTTFMQLSTIAKSILED